MLLKKENRFKSIIKLRLHLGFVEYLKYFQLCVEISTANCAKTVVASYPQTVP